jgi:hypothetical protein
MRSILPSKKKANEKHMNAWLTVKKDVLRIVVRETRSGRSVETAC